MRIILSLLFLLFANSAPARLLKMNHAHDTVVGQIETVIVRPNETLPQIARRCDVGFFQLLQANPMVEPKELLPGMQLIVPSKVILPPVPKVGVVINLAEMRLYYFFPHSGLFYVFPVGIGMQGWNTPEGKLHIVEKIKHPVWHVPNSIYQFRKKNNDPVPRIVQPGPNNPLGHYAIRLSKQTYLIHGTNEPDSVGERSSAGCIHLYPEDIKQLFSVVSRGTPVRIINAPYLAGRQGKRIFASAQWPLSELRTAWKLQDKAVFSHFKAAQAVLPEIQAAPLFLNVLTTEHLGLPVALPISKNSR